MKYLILALIIVSACTSNHASREATSAVEEEKDSSIREVGIEHNLYASTEEFWSKRYPSNKEKAELINSILASSTLSQNNTDFLQQLAMDTMPKGLLERSIAPIFRLDSSEIGLILTESNFKDSKERSAFENHFTFNDSLISYDLQNIGLTTFAPNQPKISNHVYVYSASNISKTSPKQFGVFTDACLSYAIYTLSSNEFNLKDSLLFSSPLKLELEFENNPHIDSILQNSAKEEYFDCPSSHHLFQTFAKLKGAENLYFAFADNFPVNNQSDTPARALVYFESETAAPVFLWYDDVDLFGCSCL